MRTAVKNNRGSILIMVLWTLIMITYLVGDYLIHNRSKTGIALNLGASFKQQNAIGSLVHLITADEWKEGVDNYRPEKWVDMEVAGVDLRFRLDNESGRININTAEDAQIRQTMVDILPETAIEKANMLTDALLDWRDANDLIRLNGAEKREYAAAGLGYLPADGLFKTLTEVLMLKGMTKNIFWGEPGKNPPETDGDVDEGADTENAVLENEDHQKDSVLERFTIFDAGVQRLSILIPLRQNNGARLFVVMFLKSQKSLDVIERYTQLLEGKSDL